MKVPYTVIQHINTTTPSANSANPNLRKSTSPKPSLLQRFASQLLQWLTGSEQIKVSQKRDRSGNVYYQVRDQFTGQTETFYSREDVLIWLEKQRFSS